MIFFVSGCLVVDTKCSTTSVNICLNSESYNSIIRLSGYVYISFIKENYTLDNGL